MKKATLLLLISLLITLGCQTNKIDTIKFSSSADTILIRTTKQKGSGPFTCLGVSSASFKEITDSFPYPIVCPEGIDNLKRMKISTDFGATSKYYVDIIKGQKDNDSILIVDENNNKDLSDDSVRIVQPINWKSEKSLIKINYTVTKEGKAFEDSTWLRIGELDNGIWKGRSEHLTAKFYIDNDLFVVGIVAPSSGDFTYKFMTEIALLSHNSMVSDTIFEKDMIKEDEFLKLQDSYYKFDSISYFGDYLRLVKENNFDQMVGTQVGMIAPPFICVTVNGDTLNSTSLHDRILIIANSCGCGGDKKSTEAFFEMSNKFRDQIHIIRLDTNIKKGQDGYHVDVDDECNKKIHDIYRQMYCSRTCFVIGKDNRIIDKFPVYKWQQFLTKTIEKLP